MTINVNRADQAGPEDGSSGRLALLARIIAGNILREKEDKAEQPHISDEIMKRKKQGDEDLPGH